jgi:SAM-dependent methyltransferase
LIWIEDRGYSLQQGEYAHLDFTARLRERLAQLGGGSVCELGGGANPAIELDFVREHDLTYLVVDVSADELQKAPDGYQKLVADVGSPEFAAGEHIGAYDLVFSRVLAEHVRDGMQLHRNVHRLLRPGGIAMHFFPTLWWPPFVVNRILPESISEPILLRLQPWRERSGDLGKFPAYYSWCFGPTKAQVGRFASTGFMVEHCVAYYGDGYDKGSFLTGLEQRWIKLMVRHPNHHLTAFAAYTLRAC